MAVQYGMHARLEVFRRGLGAIAEVEDRLGFAGDDVVGAGAAVDIGNLERGRREVGIAAIPFGGDQFGQGRRQAMNGVIRFLRVGDMALLAMHMQIAAKRTAPADDDAVAQLGIAGGLADDGVVRADAAAAQNLGHVFGAMPRHSFLVAGDQKRQAALECATRQQAFGGADHRRQSALHVRGAAAVEHAIADLRQEGVAGPAIERTGWDHIGMPGENCQRAVGTESGPQVGDALLVEPFQHEAKLGQALTDQRAAAGVVRSQGAAGDQFLGQAQGGGVGLHRGHGSIWQGLA